jgi:hypothetical protein
MTHNGKKEGKIYHAMHGMQARKPSGQQVLRLLWQDSHCTASGLGAVQQLRENSAARVQILPFLWLNNLTRPCTQILRFLRQFAGHPSWRKADLQQVQQCSRNSSDDTMSCLQETGRARGVLRDSSKNP